MWFRSVDLLFFSYSDLDDYDYGHIQQQPNFPYDRGKVRFKLMLKVLDDVGFLTSLSVFSDCEMSTSLYASDVMTYVVFSIGLSVRVGRGMYVKVFLGGDVFI